MNTDIRLQIESFRGPAGKDGAVGPMGPRGPKGEKGDKGDPGSGGGSYGVTPEEYGAVGDGVTDDHDAIVKAMNAAVAAHLPLTFSGGKIYLIRRYWEMVSDLTIEGNGAIVLTDMQDGSGWDNCAIRIAGTDASWVHDVTVKDIELRASDDCPARTLLQVMRCRDIVLSGVTLTCDLNLHDERRCCFDVYGAFENILFENCRFNQLSGVLEGGCWVREWRNDAVSRNIRFINCDFLKAGADEVFAVWGWRGIVKEVLISGCTFDEIDDEKYWTNVRFRPYWYITLGQTPKRGNGEMSTEIQFTNNIVRSSHCECVFRMLGDGTHTVVDNCDFYITQDPMVPEHNIHNAANQMLVQSAMGVDVDHRMLHSIMRNCRGYFQGDSGRRLTYAFGIVENCTFEMEGLGGIFASTHMVRGNVLIGHNMNGGFNDCNNIIGNRIILDNSQPQIWGGYSVATDNVVEINSPEIGATGFPICTSGSWGGSTFARNTVTWTVDPESKMRKYQFIDSNHFVFDNRFYSNAPMNVVDNAPGYLYRNNNYFNDLPEKLFRCTGVAFDEPSITVNYKKKLTATAAVTPENCTDPVVYTFKDTDGVMELRGHNGYQATKDGTVTVTATCGSYDATQTISVKLLPAPCETLTLSRTSVRTGVGRTTYIKAIYAPYWTTDELTFRSSDEDIFSITDDGEITAHKLGSAKITAVCGGMTAECPVEVVEDSELPSYQEGEWTLDGTVGYVPLPSVGENHTLYMEVTIALDSITEARGRISIATTAENGQESGYAPVSLDFIKTNGFPTYDWGTVDSETADSGKGVYKHINYINTGLFTDEDGASIHFLFKPDGVYNSGMENPIWGTLEDERELQKYSGYMFFNVARSESEPKLQSYASSDALRAALEAGDIHASAAKNCRITRLILYSHDLYTTLDEILKYREGADIDIRFDENGMPVNAGTSGALIWSSGNTQESGDTTAKLGTAKLGKMKL